MHLIIQSLEVKINVVKNF